jgi:hypothetical protein
MRETFTSGSVRGVRSNPHPYRDQTQDISPGLLSGRPFGLHRALPSGFHVGTDPQCGVGLTMLLLDLPGPRPQIQKE